MLLKWLAHLEYLYDGFAQILCACKMSTTNNIVASNVKLLWEWLYSMNDYKLVVVL